MFPLFQNRRQISISNVWVTSFSDSLNDKTNQTVSMTWFFNIRSNSVIYYILYLLGSNCIFSATLLSGTIVLKRSTTFCAELSVEYILIDETSVKSKVIPTKKNYLFQQALTLHLGHLKNIYDFIFLFKSPVTNRLDRIVDHYTMT